MEALAGASRAAYTTLIGHPGLVDYFQNASPLDETRPAQHRLAAGAAHRRALALGPARHPLGVRLVAEPAHDHRLVRRRLGAQELHRRARPAGETHLKRMFEQSPLFRLILDEVEKTLMMVDLEIAHDYALLVPDATVRDQIFGMIKAEYELTCEMVLQVSGGSELAERYPAVPRPARSSGCRPSTRSAREQIELLPAIAARPARTARGGEIRAAAFDQLHRATGLWARVRARSILKRVFRSVTEPDERHFTRAGPAPQRIRNALGGEHPNELHPDPAGHAAPAPLGTRRSRLQPALHGEGGASRPPT